MDFLEYLAQAIERTGHSVSRDTSFFIVEPINLKIECEIGERGGRNTVIVQLNIKATHEQLFPDGIWDCLAGIGEDDDKAFSYAAQAWTEGIFLTIHEILVPAETKEFQVPRFDMLTRNQETGEEFGWKLYLGAFQAAGEFSSRTDLDETILVKQLASPLSSVLQERRLFWVKSYIAKLSATDIQGDCWLNNQNWIEGLNTLYWFAEGWKDVKSFAAMKQFVIFKPCEISEIKDAEKIRQALPPLEKRGFFSKLFGR